MRKECGKLFLNEQVAGIFFFFFSETALIWFVVDVGDVLFTATFAFEVSLY